MNENLTTPRYSFWPLFLALSILLLAVGIVSTIGISVFALVLLFAAIVGWVWENRTEEQEDRNE